MNNGLKSPNDRGNLISFQFKNIYEQIGYQAPYSSEDCKVILHRINTEPLETITKYISKPRAELIANHRPFEAVEQLLDLKGFNLKILETFLHKIHDQHDRKKEYKSEADLIKLDKDLFRSIKPKVEKTFYKTNVSTIVALSFNLFSGSLQLTYLKT